MRGFGLITYFFLIDDNTVTKNSDDNPKKILKKTAAGPNSIVIWCVSEFLLDR